MEAENYDSNKKNADFISNLQDRIVGKESMLAEKELLIKSKILILPVDPTTCMPYTCNNYNWQGSAHDDTDVKETYLRPYKNVIAIKAAEIKEGGGVDDGITPVNCGSRYYKSWIIPVFGQDSDKLAENFDKKNEMNLLTKADRALEMLRTMQLGGV